MSTRIYQANKAWSTADKAVGLRGGVIDLQRRVLKQNCVSLFLNDP